MHSRRASQAFVLTPRLVGAIVAASCALAGGCGSTPRPDVLHIDSSVYHAAFDAAMDAARRNGMPPTLRDRRRGVIETEPSIAPSIFEPWRRGNTSLGQALESTIAFQRRRARFEFVAADDLAPPPASPPGVTGPDLLGANEPQIDLSEYHGDLELRVWVFVERAYAPGIRRNTWTRRKTTRTTIAPAEPDGEPLPSMWWTPVSRDAAVERLLLVAIDRSLARQARRQGESSAGR